ncbi:MAG: hypothetical protein MJE68_29900, partial [Proteobacteria bacterium]|nr:hypothetical protein [Pseudomonadota bacterium]
MYTKVKPHSITQTGNQNIDCSSDRAGNTATSTSIDNLHFIIFIPHTMSCISPPTVTPPVPSRETATAAVCEPMTTEQLFSFLHPHASKWQSLGIALLLDKDRLEDEVFPNNETDEACL